MIGFPPYLTFYRTPDELVYPKNMMFTPLLEERGNEVFEDAFTKENMGEWFCMRKYSRDEKISYVDIPQDQYFIIYRTNIIPMEKKKKTMLFFILGPYK